MEYPHPDSGLASCGKQTVCMNMKAFSVRGELKGCQGVVGGYIDHRVLMTRHHSLQRQYRTTIDEPPNQPLQSVFLDPTGLWETGLAAKGALAAATSPVPSGASGVQDARCCCSGISKAGKQASKNLLGLTDRPTGVDKKAQRLTQQKPCGHTVVLTYVSSLKYKEADTAKRLHPHSRDPVGLIQGCCARWRLDETHKLSHATLLTVRTRLSC